MRIGSGFLGLVLICLLFWGPGRAQDSDPSEDLGALAAQIQNEVVALRGLEFKRPVVAKAQTTDGLREYLDQRVEKTLPSKAELHYGKIVKKLGLYRGPEIQNAPALMKSVVLSQVAAYYDPRTSAFHVMELNLPEPMRSALFAHELYHGLQDQYFDLESYYAATVVGGIAENDVQIARQAVVEGEAQYIMTLWMMQRTLGRVPPRELLGTAVRMQAAMDVSSMMSILESPQASEALGSDFQAAIAASRQIPPFIMDMLLGAYLKGMGFVFDVQAKGWSEVEKLYTEYPPVSTEQILHSEKWFARETPLKIDFSRLEQARELQEWELLAQNSVGEFLWRTIFKEHGMASEAEELAAGWDGDRYAVLRHKNDGRLLLLLNTAWDTEADAIQFADGYSRLLKVKYENDPQPIRLERKGKQVFVVEGGDQRSLSSLLKLVKKAKATRLKA